MEDSGEKWGINMLMGEYHHNVDEKKRLIIPSKFRSELGEKVVITRGLEKCLFLYREDEFQKLVEKLKNMPFTKQRVREFSRFLLSGATLVEFDKQGRINLAPHLVSYANIVKECTIIGIGDRVEIWSDNSWNDFYSSTFDDMSEIADELFSDNFSN